MGQLGDFSIPRYIICDHSVVIRCQMAVRRIQDSSTHMSSALVGMTGILGSTRSTDLVPLVDLG